MMSSKLGSSLLKKYDLPLVLRCQFRYSSGAAASPTSGKTPVTRVTRPLATSDAGQRGAISKAMKAYLDRAEKHQEFMAEQEQEFVFGKRHLANMMGKDPETFGQDDINEAIRYLFPSGLTLRARPIMKPPSEIYPKQKAAEFDKNGRPHHSFFYTAQPNFFFLLHELVNKLNRLNSINSQGLVLSPIENTALAGSIWLTKDELEVKIMEKIKDGQYEEWVSSMNKIAEHQYSNKELDYIKGFRKPLSSQTIELQLPPIVLEPDGTKSVTVTGCIKKTAEGVVRVRMPGRGEILVNGQDLGYFERIQSREAILFPLQLTGWMGTVDIEATVEGAAETSQAMAVRYGISTGIAALGADKEKLRLAGLLTKDTRRKERSHVGHVGARAAWTWKKR